MTTFICFHSALPLLLIKVIVVSANVAIAWGGATILARNVPAGDYLPLIWQRSSHVSDLRRFSRLVSAVEEGSESERERKEARYTDSEN